MDYLYSSLDPAIDGWCYVVAAILMMVTGIVVNFYRIKKKLTWIQCIGISLLVTYVFLMFSSTVFSRSVHEKHLYELQPFWSYVEIWNGDWGLFWQDILNIVLFIPAGFFLSMALRIKNSNNKHTAVTVVWLGFFTSVCIEGSQLIFRRGLFEFDDMFHNTLGGLIGCSIYLLIHRISIKMNQR